MNPPTKTTALGAFLMLSGFVLPAAAQDAAGQDAVPTEAAETEAPAGYVDPAPVAEPLPVAPMREACDNGEDDDGDELADCADADCFEHAACEAGQGEERNDERCSDWVDNDADGAVDCDDSDCSGPGITVCQGSWQDHSGGAQGGQAADEEVLPELTGDMTVEDLIGTGGDNDGERNEYLCSDGIDNDGDGRTDCADFGCRFDPQITVCQSSPGFRFSIVAGMGASLQIDGEDADREGHPVADVFFSRIQARALGPIPFIDNSFFLLSMRLERSPRLVFALFQVPLGDSGHYVNLNSGSGGLSSGLIVSSSKNPLLDPPYYLYNAFEQGNGASLEVGGPLTTDGRLRYRAFAAGGSGEFNGNVGGRFYRSDLRNFTWGAGAQIGLNIIGRSSRFDSAFLYTPGPLTLGLLIGGKYDERARERYPAGNAQLFFRYSRFLLRLENYTKYELEYGALQTAWNAQTSILLVPRMLMLAADIGQFYSHDFPDDVEFDSDLRRPLDELQWRVALHWFWYRNIGVLSATYTDRQIEENPDRPEDTTNERLFGLEAQFRF